MANGSHAAYHSATCYGVRRDARPAAGPADMCGMAQPAARADYADTLAALGRTATRRPDAAAHHLALSAWLPGSDGSPVLRCPRAARSNATGVVLRAGDR